MPTAVTKPTMLCPRQRGVAALTALVLLLALAPVAAASSASAASVGGMAAAEPPKITALKCGTGDQRACPRGYVLRLSGENLAGTTAVVFLGGKGGRDDRRARPTEKSPHRVLVTVPDKARSGPVRVVTRAGARTGPRLRVLAAVRARSVSLVPAAAGGVFPIVGKHRYGTETNRFGGGRGHQGQDVFADCGTPVVAALPGEVQIAKYHSRAGNYVVIHADDGTSQAYMHLRQPALVSRGDRVVAGQQLGEVGDTGRASGCHLHFEFWTAPGWYEGGSPIDPLSMLRRWDAAEPAPAPAPASPA